MDPVTDEPLETQDLRRLGEVLTTVIGTGGEVWVTIAPAQPPTIERKGLFGRTKREPATWCLRVQHLGTGSDPAGFAILVEHPPGGTLAERGVPVPEQSHIEFDEGDTVYVIYDRQVTADDIAAEAVRLARALIGPQAGDTWTITVEGV